MTAVFIRDPKACGLEDFLRRRRELELDRFDEVWEGVLHMSPPPHKDHQEIVTWLAEVFRVQARRHGSMRVYVQAGLRAPGSGESNYRVPDLLVAPRDREQSAGGWLESGVSLVVEVRSPREEVMAKLPFYAARGVEEVLYLDPRTFAFDLLRRAGDTYLAASADREGFVEIRSAMLRFRRIERDGKPALEIEDACGGGPLPPL